MPEGATGRVTINNDGSPLRVTGIQNANLSCTLAINQSKAFDLDRDCSRPEK